MYVEEEGKTWSQYLAAFAAASATIASGIHFAWPSPSIKMLPAENYDFNITSDDASYITDIGLLGGVVGSILCSYMMDAIGRKYILLLIAIPQICSFAMIALVDLSSILYCARFIEGIAEGCCFIAIPTYVGEVVEPKVRSVLGSCITFYFVIGILFINILAIFFSFQTTATICTLIPMIYVVVLWQLPESPYYAIMKDRPEVAERSLVFLRRKKDVHKELMQIASDVSRQMSEPGGWVDLFKIKSNRTACIAMGGMTFIQQLAGIISFNVYYQVLFQETTALSPLLCLVLFCVVQSVMTSVSATIVNKSGRKPLLMSASSFGGLIVILLGIFFTVKHWTDLDVSYLQWIPVLGIMLYTSSFALGIGSTVDLLLGELFSISVKAKALCLMNLVFSVPMAMYVTFFQLTKDRIGVFVLFYVLGLCALAATVFCYFYVPETKGKTLEEIQQELKREKE